MDKGTVPAICKVEPLTMEGVKEWSGNLISRAEYALSLRRVMEVLMSTRREMGGWLNMALTVITEVEEQAAVRGRNSRRNVLLLGRGD